MIVEETLKIAATILIAYLCGSIPFGFLIGKLKGIDIRQHGSGNIGATNVTRVIGRGWGRTCFVLDLVKGFLPVMAACCLTKYGYVSDNLKILPCIAALATVCGHIWPVWLKFMGGKGVSTAAGAILALSPVALPAAGVVWVIVFFASRYVSLASISAAATLPIFCWGFGKYGIGPEPSLPEQYLLILIAAIAILKHTSNIKRLLQGTENRFSKKTSGDENEKK